MTATLVSDDFAVLCNFEIALRNVLAWHGQARRVIARQWERGLAVEPVPIDSALVETERLVRAIGTLRARLAPDHLSPGKT